MKKDLNKRIIELSYKNKLSHVGSAITSVNIIDTIYDIKRKDDKFVLSNGHANLALQVVLKNRGLIDKESLDTHPDRLTQNGIDCSTGSLGHGLLIALGMALARQDENIYCLISDGECAEGSIWEALKVASDNNLTNLKIIVNANGWGAYHAIQIEELIDMFRAFGWGVIPIENSRESLIEALTKSPSQIPFIVFVRTNVDDYPFLSGLNGHYYVPTKADYEST